LARRNPPRQRAIPGSEPSQGFAPSLAALWLDLVATVKPRRMLTQHGCPIAPATYYDDVGRGPTDSPAFTPLIPAAQGHCRASPRAAFEPWFERLGGPSPWGSFWTITPPSPPGVPSQSCVALCALRNTDVGRGWLRVRVGKPGVLLLRRLGPGRGGGVGVAMVRCWSADRCSGLHGRTPDSAPRTGSSATGTAWDLGHATQSSQP